jgi:hypothetical protein
MNTKRHTLAVLLVLVTVAPATAMADGMSFQTASATSEVRATEQRAVMWLRDGAWEIHIQPVFDREAGAASWVVPFPVRPTVGESDADFFDQLEAITSPVFMSTCWESHDSVFGCMAMKGDANSLSDASQSSVSVNVWERGEVGDLDYVILSAVDSESLVAWLESNGYAIPSGMGDAIADLDTEGQYFFAATLDPDADPSLPLMPVRFELPDMDVPTYPLRLTGFGVSGWQRLELTIWIITSQDDWHVPSSHPYDYLYDGYSVDVADGDEFDNLVDTFFEDHGANAFAALAAIDPETLRFDIIDNRRVCNMDWTCASFDELGLDVPAPWSGDLLDVADSSQWIFRFQGRLDAGAMSQDLILAPGELERAWWALNVYSTSIGSCESADDEGCAISGMPAVGGGAGSLALLTLLFLMRVRRR